MAGSSSDNKTQPTAADVTAYLQSVTHEGRREDSFELLELMQRVSGEPPVMWGSSIIGFGQYHYRYESGREGDFFLTGFAPRKANLVVYIMPGFEAYQDQIERLGKCKTSRSCLYLGRLKNVDQAVLEDMIADSVRVMRERYNVA